MTMKNSTMNFKPLDALAPSPGELAFIQEFGARVIAQPDALEVARLAYRSYKNPLRDKSRPIGVYYLVGPSRTGKSLTGEVLAEIFHGDRNALIRIQASDYEEDHQILDIKGAPPSYIGYRDPHDPKNKLDISDEDPTSIVSNHNLRRARRGSKEKVNIVIIEEFEKSTYDFYKLWMGVFDKGKLKLANGQTVDFTNTIFILTSNLGTDELEKLSSAQLGFQRGERTLSPDEIKSVVQTAMRRRFRREFRNRLDKIVIFRQLTKVDMRNIVDAEIKQVSERIFLQMSSATYFVMKVEDSAKTFLLAKCGTEIAELKRVINQELMMPLGRLLDEENCQIQGNDLLLISHDGKSDMLSFAVAAGAGEEQEKEDGGNTSGSPTKHPPQPFGTPQREQWDDEDEARQVSRPHRGVFFGDLEILD
ncbi:MAG: AAA family ATPase [Candidatus Obscuribacterales bacterium]|nr:AAA family ATPase [Candidatus Obscuribacterales bacterium]